MIYECLITFVIIPVYSVKEDCLCFSYACQFCIFLNTLFVKEQNESVREGIIINKIHNMDS